ncbi:CBS domain-containing protein CBSX5-like protein [Carex littledalei]|uniref:CBS domain-containing protein CBSX5-like protein n=1 Tax=Carex littledalei TaxID=544730 RepID=A0A833VGH4_9POAL|nr:CBS domain-containing protein CBSX5-like protein [Carex littledalei]
MAVSILCHDISDLCIGKPAVSSLHLSAAVSDAISSLRRSPSQFLLIISDKPSPEKKPAAIAGSICLVDVVCFLCSEGKRQLVDPAGALGSSVLLQKGRVRRVEPHSSVLDALDAILDGGATELVIPLWARSGSRKKHSTENFCLLTQEDLVRYFLASISVLSSIVSLSVSSLDLIQHDFPSIQPRYSATSALSLLNRHKTPVAVITETGHLISELSASIISSLDLAAVKGSVSNIATFSVDEFVGWIEGIARKSGRSVPEVVVCQPGSSLVAVMVQALAHRVDHVWVVDEKDDCKVVGIVTFTDILRVFRYQLTGVEF